MRSPLSFLVHKDLPWPIKQFRTWPAALFPIHLEGGASPLRVLLNLFLKIRGSCFYSISVSSSNVPRPRGFPSPSCHLPQALLVLFIPFLLSCFTFSIRYLYLRLYYTSSVFMTVCCVTLELSLKIAGRATSLNYKNMPRPMPGMHVYFP